MTKRLIVISLALLISACAPQPDRCTADPTLPDCQTARASSDATIAAINSERAATNREATRQAKAADAAAVVQRTQAAAAADATRIAVSAFGTQSANDVKAQATRHALEIQAMNQSLMVSATIAAINVDTARVKSQIELSTTQLVGQADVERSTAQSQAAGPAEWIKIIVGLVAVLALVATIVYGINRVTAAVSDAADTRANLVRYGYQNSRVAYRIKHADGTFEFIPIDQILGHSSRYLGTLTTVPEMAQLAAVVEADKRLKLTHVAQHTNAFPVLPGLAADQTLPAPSADRPVNESGLLTVPSFAQCLKIWQPRMDQMMLGYGQSGPIYCGLEDLLSVGIVGRPKTGKSTVLRFIFVQCVLVGAQVVVWDLHRTIVGSLPGANALTRLSDIDASAEQLAAELDRRLEAEAYTDQPIMVLADEYPLLAPNSSAATATLNRIILEGRKVNLFSMIAGQGLPAELFGGSTARDALSSRYVLHTTTRAARMAGLEKDQAPWVVDLKQGQAVVDGPVDAQIISIPNTTADDVKSVLATSGPIHTQFFATSATSVEVAPHFQTAQPEVALEVGPEVTAEVAVEVGSERHNQVRDLLRAQTPISQIVKQVWGVGPGGRAYQEATAELRQIMSELVQ